MRLILFTLSAIALLLVAAIVGPSFVDWNKYKPQIIEQVKNATGLDVQVGGDLSLSILPSPRVKIEDLVVVSPKKIQFDNLLSMKSAEVSVALIPLFQKKIKISSVKLIEPNIQIEMMEDGTPSWQTDKLAKAKAVSEATPQEVKDNVTQGASKALESIALDKLEIKKGKLSFINHKTKSKQNIDDINVVLKADSLRGPFSLDGKLIYDGKKIAIEAETGKLPNKDEALSIQAEITLPDAGSKFSFGGVAAIKEPYDVQGQTTIKIESPSKLAGMFGASLGAQYNQSLMLNGLLSADQNKVSYNDLKVSFGNFVGNGKISVQNLQSKNPLNIMADIKSSSMLDLDSFVGKSSKSASSSDKSLKSAGKGAVKQNSFVPQSLTLPMAIDAAVKIDLAGLKVQGKKIKGVFVDLKKTGKTSKIIFKSLELPGQGKADGTLNVTYASSSKSPKSGQVVYADPSVSYTVNGQVGQLAEFFKAFAPDADTSAVTKLYKTAQFNLKGAVKGDSVSLKDSTLKLGQMVIGLGGRYQPASNAKRAKAVIDVSAGSVDFDQIMSTRGGKSTPSKASGSATKGSAKEVLKPLQGFSLPLDLVFDISLQKARINQADLNGLRLTGDLTGKKLNLKTASVNNFAGAALSVKGQVGNLSDLSGLDLSFYTKTSDVGRLAQALKADISKLPKGLKAVEANVTAKGAIDKLTFTSNVSALGGQLDAAGNVTNVLGTPSFNNLSVRVKHSNLVKAIQIMSPEFKGQAGLNQAIDFYTKASTSGKAYSLSDMKVTLGQTSFGGNLKIDTGAKIPAIRGNIKAGKIALDSLLGAKGGSKSSAGGSGGSSKSSSAKSSGTRWSKAPIDLSWMNNIDVDVALAASSITYGAWNFIQPSTSLKIGNGVMSVKGMKAGIFGGQATLSTEVKANPVSLTLSNNMNNIDLEKLAKALSGGGKLKSTGKVSFNMEVNSAGGSAYALVNALNGKANLDGKDVVLKGFDLAKLARGLAVEEKLATSVNSLVSGATSGGQTRFDTVKGGYKITKGIVNITSMVMDSDDAVITSTGTADLPKWFINVDNKITLKSVPDLAPFEVKIKGPIDNPSDTFGKNILEDYLGAKIKRKLAKELPDILGDNVTDKLKKFGILPSDPAPAPTSAPVEGGVVPTPVQQEPVQQKQKQPDVEDVLKDVLKGLF